MARIDGFGAVVCDDHLFGLGERGNALGVIMIENLWAIIQGGIITNGSMSFGVNGLPAGNIDLNQKITNEGRHLEVSL